MAKDTLFSRGRKIANLHHKNIVATYMIHCDFTAKVPQSNYNKIANILTTGKEYLLLCFNTQKPKMANCSRFSAPLILQSAR
ncbi:unnamed protein product [Dovyalis caffra]|uniref:Uncharacterized protein n=1 Tax=Dovyalis caffra TaxID=77055 RepID=A0AAV1R634_9ROSI|nr:unnamed protein product [Dovyalis caffra]